MDNADYTQVALRLANARLGIVDDLRAALHDEPWWADRATNDDLVALRAVADELRDTLDAAVHARHDELRDRVNHLLEQHPPRPRLSGHGSRDGLPNWHIHVADVDAPPATEVAAAASWGLAYGVVQHGSDRWGQCHAEDCGTYFLDTSTNQAKRFCSPRCANRVHVAAFRARRRS